MTEITQRSEENLKRTHLKEQASDLAIFYITRQYINNMSREMCRWKNLDWRVYNIILGNLSQLQLFLYIHKRSSTLVFINNETYTQHCFFLLYMEKS